MTSIETKYINNSITRFLSRVDDIENFEGPLLTLFIHLTTNKLYLFEWIESSETHNRWLIYNVEPHFMLQFIQQKISLKTVFESNPEHKYYYFDTDGTVSFNEFSLHEIVSMPKEYVPSENRFFDIEANTSLVKTEALLKSQITSYISSQNLLSRVRAWSVVERKERYSKKAVVHIAETHARKNILYFDHHFSSDVKVKHTVTSGIEVLVGKRFIDKIPYIAASSGDLKSYNVVHDMNHLTRYGLEKESKVIKEKLFHGLVSHDLYG